MKKIQKRLKRVWEIFCNVVLPILAIALVVFAVCKIIGLGDKEIRQTIEAKRATEPVLQQVTLTLVDSLEGEPILLFDEKLDCPSVIYLYTN